MLAVHEQVPLMKLFLQWNMSATICSWTVRHVTELIIFHYFKSVVTNNYCKQQSCLERKTFVCHLSIVRRFPNSVSFYISVSFFYSQEVEWKFTRHLFCDVCCLRPSSADKLFLERNASTTICSRIVGHITGLIVFHYFRSMVITI